MPSPVVSGGGNKKLPLLIGAVAVIAAVGGFFGVKALTSDKEESSEPDITVDSPNSFPGLPGNSIPDFTAPPDSSAPTPSGNFDPNGPFDSSDNYPEVVRNNFMGACAADPAMTDYCTCSLEAFEANYSLSEFAELDSATNLPAEAEALFSLCFIYIS